MSENENSIKFEVVDDNSNLYGDSMQAPSQSLPQPQQQQQSNIQQRETSFEDIVKEYLEKNKVKIYILTPCFASLCYVNYVYSLMNTIELFKKLNIPLKIEFCKNDSLVSRARNNLIARGMTDPEATHFLFIDNDITWQPIDIVKLIISDKDLVGGVYPLKQYEWEKLIKDPQNEYNSNIVQSLLKKKNESALKEMISDTAMIQHSLLRYNINYINNYIEISNNLTKVRHLATGFMMIRRPLIEKLMIAHPNTKYVDDIGFLRQEENPMAYALFDCGVEEGHYFSEDWMFCHRASKLGTEIFVDVSISLSHTGIEDYHGCYLSTII